MNRRFTAYLLLLLVSMIWGAAGPVIKFTLADFPPLIFLSYRFFISTIISVIYFGVARPKWPKGTLDQGKIATYGLLSTTLALGLLFFAFDKTTSLSGTLLTSTTPLVLVVAGGLFFHDHITKIERVGITIAMIGTLITILYPLFSGNGIARGTIEGNALATLHVFVDAASVLVAKGLVRKKVSAIALAQSSFIIGFLTITPLVLFLYSFQDVIATILNAPLSAHLGVWYMAVVSGSLAYAMRNRALKSIELSETAVFGYLLPIWAAPLSIYWLGEKIAPAFLIGAAIIATGVIIAEHKRRKIKMKIKSVFIS